LYLDNFDYWHYETETRVTKIYCYSLETLSIVHSGSISGKRKHICVRITAVHELTIKKLVAAEKKRNGSQSHANIFTKN
jgi:hypothetical protein